MKVNGYIDNTLLKPFSRKSDIEKLAKDSIPYEFASICILPCHIEYAKEVIGDDGLKIATVIGFPLGANTTRVKVFETKDALERGASEIDMVINISWARDKKYDRVKQEIKEIFNAVKSFGNDKKLKVIIENCYLEKDQIVELCKICKDIGVDFVKTSTGFGTGGATIEDVELMKQTLGDFPNIKAAGGIRAYKDADAFIKAGATRLGTSNGFAISDGEEGKEKY